MISLDLLRRQELFQGLTNEVLEELLIHIRLREFSAHSFVLQSGDPSDALLLLISGQLQIISTSESGKEIGLNFIDEGEHFGEVGLIDGGPRSASVVAITPAVIGFLAKEHALKLFHHNSLVAARVQQKLCKIIRSETKNRSIISGSKAFTRVFMVLSKHPKLKESQRPSKLENIPSQAVIARMANVSRETVSRALSSLAKAGVIAKRAKQLEINDPQIIHRLASGEVSIDHLANQSDKTSIRTFEAYKPNDPNAPATHAESPKNIVVIRHKRKMPAD